MAAPDRSPVGVVLDRSAPPRARAPELDEQQRAVVEHRDGHLLVLAGPGTGKTTTLAELIVARIGPEAGDRRLEPGQVLALTFGRRAARELSDRISRRVGGGTLPVVSTFHSFAYGVLRQYADPAAFVTPPRLLTAAEQDARLRELLVWSVAEGRLAWPESLAGAVGTRGIAEQVRALLARARGQGLDGRDLARMGRRDGVPAWTAVGRFFQEYLDTLDFEGALDYAELVHRAVALASKETQGRALRETYRLIVVDEYQDTDPAQVRLLSELARGGAQVVAVGDPDQAIYGFRGADVGGIGRFADDFRDPVTGTPARIEVLRTTRRFPRAIAEAAGGVLGPPPSGLPAEVLRLHRAPIAREGSASVEVRTYPRASAQAAGIAETLLAAHSDGPERSGLPWSEMAVLVRNPAVHAAPIARALRAAGIPVAISVDEVALADEPGVRTLLSVVALALDPEAVPPDTGRMLLAGPIGRVDAVGIRALARAALHSDPPSSWGRAERGRRAAPSPRSMPAGSQTSDDLAPATDDSSSSWGRAERGRREAPSPGSIPLEAPPPDESSDVRLTRLLGHAPEASSGAGPSPSSWGGAKREATDAFPSSWGRAERGRRAAPSPGSMPVDIASLVAGAGPRASEGFARVTAAVSAAHSAIESGALVSEVLWAAWAATDWPERLRDRALRGGFSATSANRDLDALVALFELANRLPSERAGRVGMVGFLGDVRQLRIPQESGLAPAADRDQVRLLSAHRAKGLEWELVVVASVQEGEWPDVRLRSDLLRVDELDRAGRQPGRTYRDLLAEERRLMYVACTRARSALVVTAVAEPVDGGAQPSRFLGDLGVPVAELPARSANPASGTALITALRAAASAPTRLRADGSPDPEVEGLRGAAIERLALLTASSRAAGFVGGPVVAADPARWWGARSVTGPSGGATSPGPVGPSAGSVREMASGGSEDAWSSPPIRLSPSSVEALRTCPLRWFLERKVGAGTPPGAAAAVGVVVHAVAEALARGEVSEDRAAIGALVDDIWGRMPFAARYQSTLERGRVDEMVTALLEWHRATGRRLMAAEAPFRITLPTSAGDVLLAGTIDRIDQDDEGRLHLVDFKTGRTAASAAAAAENPQLGIYQLAVREGAIRTDEPGDESGASGAGASVPALPGVAPDEPGRAEGSADLGSGDSGLIGGAELVHLADRYASGLPKVRQQAGLPDGRTWVHEVVVDAARLAVGPDYPARRNSRCATCAFHAMCPVQSPRIESTDGRTALGIAAGDAPGGVASAATSGAAAVTNDPEARREAG